MRLNDATPSDWDGLRRAHPAIEKDSIDYGPYIDMAMQEAHAYEHEESIRKALQDLATKQTVAEDVVNSPSHYNSGGIECIQAIEASMELEAFQGYLKGNTLKYLWRMSYKGKALEDCKKAQWYLNKLISTLEKSE
tara:strand:- start:15 stop:422 length:408 start_codon:yes stop_codon:yes gene_type:complete